MRRVVAAAIVVAAACLLFVRPAQAGTAEEAGTVADVNAVRAGLGLRPLEPHPELERKAEDWAAHVAEARTLAHSAPTDGITAAWLSLAENVAVAGTAGAAERALLSSPIHYANIVDPDMTHIGVGVVAGGGQVYMVQEFMQLATTSRAGAQFLAGLSVFAAGTSTIVGRRFTARPLSSVLSRRRVEAGARHRVVGPPGRHS